MPTKLELDTEYKNIMGHFADEENVKIIFAVWSNNELWHVGFKSHKDLVLKALVKISCFISVGYMEFLNKASVKLNAS